MAASSSYVRRVRRPLKSRTGTFARRYGATYTPKTYNRSRAAPRAVVYRTSGELKGVDTSLALSPVTSTTNTNDSMFVLNLVQQGAGSWNRVGRKLSLYSLRLTGALQFNSSPGATTGNVTDSLCRMVVVFDKQPSGQSVPKFDDIFGITVQAGTESSTIVAPLRYDNTDRFRVLRDRIFQGNTDFFNSAGGTTDQIRQQIPFDEFIKLGLKETVFSGQSDPMTIADISSGALYVYFRAFNNSTETYFDVSAQSLARPLRS